MNLVMIERIALTGFMGVGKSTVSRHLARLSKSPWLDLDVEIEKKENRTIAEIVDQDGIDKFRIKETEALREALTANARILSLGGGTFVNEINREILKENDVPTIWLEAGFDHCWANISASYRERPLARNRKDALKLYEERNSIYCLAEWHFVIGSGCNSFDVASQIAEQVFEITEGNR